MEIIALCLLLSLFTLEYRWDNNNILHRLGRGSLYNNFVFIIIYFFLSSWDDQGGISLGAVFFLVLNSRNYKLTF
jgi:hypothetical protein